MDKSRSLEETSLNGIGAAVSGIKGDISTYHKEGTDLQQAFRNDVRSMADILKSESQINTKTVIDEIKTSWRYTDSILKNQYDAERNSLRAQISVLTALNENLENNLDSLSAKLSRAANVSTPQILDSTHAK